MKNKQHHEKYTTKIALTIFYHYSKLCKFVHKKIGLKIFTKKYNINKDKVHFVKSRILPWAYLNVYKSCFYAPFYVGKGGVIVYHPKVPYVCILHELAHHKLHKDALCDRNYNPIKIEIEADTWAIENSNNKIESINILKQFLIDGEKDIVFKTYNKLNKIIDPEYDTEILGKKERLQNLYNLSELYSS